MIKTHTHNNIDYTIDISNPTVGSVFGPSSFSWIIKIKDAQDKPIINMELNDNLADYIERTFGTSKEDFMTNAAISEIEKL